VERFKQLQEAKEILCDDVQRKAYDYWRNSHITVPWKTWHAISERSQPVRKTKEKIQLLVFSFKILFNETSLSLSRQTKTQHQKNIRNRPWSLLGKKSQNNNNNYQHFLFYLIFHSFSSVRLFRSNKSFHSLIYTILFFLFCTQIR
jgi:curved DNA-binding protein CbpA